MFRQLAGSVFALGQGGKRSRGQLLCCPHAGGSASAFRGWPGVVPDDVELLALTLPGRGIRLKERMISDLREIARSVVDDLELHLRAPYTVFGHSMGALVGFEVVRELRRRGAPDPRVLGVSAAPAPHLAPLEKKNYSDQTLLDRLRKLGSTPEAMFNNATVMAAMLPAIRADFIASDGYRFVPEEPLNVPVLAWAGTADPVVTVEEVEHWRYHTTGPFHLSTVIAGHFYVDDHAETIAGRMVAALGGEVPPAASFYSLTEGHST